MILTCEAKLSIMSACKFACVRIDYDFTLVKIASPVKLNDHVAPACFPTESQNLEETFPPEMTCVVTGWGSIDPEGAVWGPVLKQDYAQLYSMEQCRQLESSDWVTDRMLCAGTIHTNKEVCLQECCLGSDLSDFELFDYKNQSWDGFISRISTDGIRGP